MWAEMKYNYVFTGNISNITIISYDYTKPYITD